MDAVGLTLTDDRRTLRAARVDPRGRPEHDVAVVIDVETGEWRVAPQAAEPPAPSDFWQVPALCDFHVHATRMPTTAGARLLESGVTVVRDVGGDLERIAQWAKDAPRPHISFYGGPLDQFPLSPYLGDHLGAVPIRHFGDVTTYFDVLVASGAIGTKLYYGFPSELVRATVGEAHARGLRVAYHVGTGSLPAFGRTSVLDALAAGTDSIEHIHSLTGDLLDPARKDRFIRDTIDSVGSAFGRVFSAWADIQVPSSALDDIAAAFLKAGSVFVPTLVPFAHMANAIPAARGGLVRVFAREADGLAYRLEAGFQQMLAVVQFLHEAGVTVAVGTDAADLTGVPPGESIFQEMLLFREIAMSPREVLAAGTAVGNGRHLLHDGAGTGDFAVLQGPSLASALRAAQPRLVSYGDAVLDLKPLAAR